MIPNSILDLFKNIQRVFLKLNIFIQTERFGSNDKIDVKKFLKRNRPLKTNINLIRIGSKIDGGYLLPNDFKEIKFCFSPGVSNNSDFEFNLFEKFGIKSFLADYSVDGPPIKSDAFFFKKIFINSYSDDLNITLENWMKSVDIDSNDDLILQMDIEGSEYDVLIETDIEILKKFRIMAIEFHNFHYLFNEYGFKLINSVFEKLSKVFYVVHIHPNSCSKVYENNGIQIPPIVEYTFLRKDRVKQLKNNINFPHELDHDKNFILPNCFFKF